MATTTKTYATIDDLRAALPDLPEDAVIRDRDGSVERRSAVRGMVGTFAPYTVTYEVPDAPEPEPEPADEATSLAYWLAEQMGEHVDDQDGETLVGTVKRYVSREWKPTAGANPATAPEPEPELYTPAPLDPKAVKVGDTVTLMRGKAAHTDEVSHVSHGHSTHLDTVNGRGTYVVDPANAYGWLLTAHQPAPEPEPEWLFEFKGEEGPEGDEHWVRRFPSRTDALRSMIESANLDELNDFEGPVSFSVYTEETGPAESRLVVIDPAKVDVEALRTDAFNQYDERGGSRRDRELAAILSTLAGLGITGIEATR